MARLQSRMGNYDILRVIAAFLIVILHLSVAYVNRAPESYESYQQWQLAVRISAISRPGVPIFVMLSGAFLLGREGGTDLKRIFTRYVPKIIAIFLVWSFFYALLEQDFYSQALSQGLVDAWQGLDHSRLAEDLVLGHYHMWYLYMLLGLYLVTPLLTHMCKGAATAQLFYFIGVAVVFTGVSKLNQELWHLELLGDVLEKMAFFMPLGYVGYFVAGYVLKNRSPGLVSAVVLAALGVLAYLYTCRATYEINPMFGFSSPNLVYFSNYSPTVWLMSLGIFALFALAGKLTASAGKGDGSRRKSPLGLLVAFLRRIPEYMLLVYLVHPAVIKIMKKYELLGDGSQAKLLLLDGVKVFSISLLLSMVLMEIYWLFGHIFKANAKGIN